MKADGAGPLDTARLVIDKDHIVRGGVQHGAGLVIRSWRWF
jgi:hypothetical protein